MDDPIYIWGIKEHKYKAERKNEFHVREFQSREYIVEQKWVEREFEYGQIAII